MEEKPFSFSNEWGEVLTAYRALASMEEKPFSFSNLDGATVWEYDSLLQWKRSLSASPTSRRPVVHGYMGLASMEEKPFSFSNDVSSST